MEKLAVYHRFFNPRYDTPIVLELGPEAVFFASEDYAQSEPELMEKFNQAGVEIVIGDEARALSQKYYLMEGGFRLYMDRLGPEIEALVRRLDAIGARFILTPHGSEQAFNSNRSGTEFFLAPCQTVMVDTIKRGKYLCDKSGVPLMAKGHDGLECIVGGLVYITEEILALARRDRSEMKAEVAERLKIKFNPDLPVVLYMVPQRNLIPATERGLLNLSKYANIIIKNWTDKVDPANINVFTHLTGENIFQVPCELYHNGDFTFLMRFMADAVMVGIFGSPFVTNIMAGVRTIPVYTRMMQAAVPPQPFPYTVFLNNESEGVCVKLAKSITPFDIEDTDGLARRINDQAYWQKYHRELPLLQKMIFGKYYLGRESVRHVGDSIRRILRVGTFSPPAMPEGGSVKQQIKLSVLPPVQL